MSDVQLRDHFTNIPSVRLHSYSTTEYICVIYKQDILTRPAVNIAVNKNGYLTS